MGCNMYSVPGLFLQRFGVVSKCLVYLYIFIIVGLLALLVSTNRAIPGPLHREASTDWLHDSFSVCGLTYLYTRRRGSQVTQKHMLFMNKEFGFYEASQVVALEVMVERGFAASSGDEQLESPELGGDL